MTKSFKAILLAGAMIVAPFPAIAAAQEAPDAEVVADQAAAEDAAVSDAALANAKAKMQKEMDEAIALIEQMFDTSDLPPIEPARLALAQRTTAALIPTGSLERMMDNLYGKMFKTLMGQVDGASDLMLSIKTGVESDKVAALDAASKTAVADLFDPHRQQREDQITRIVKPLISEALADLEPPMREGMAKAYARKFTADQLGELNGFFATPTGQAYASEWMAAQADPEVMLAVAKAVPPMVLDFIDRAPKVAEKFDDLPKDRSLTDLSDVELKTLAKLMKVDVQVLKDNRDAWASPPEAVEVEAAPNDDWSASDDAVDAAADAAEAAEVAADAAIEDPAYDRDNWSEADRQKVEALEEAAGNAASAVFDAQEQAVANARKTKPPMD